MTTGLVLLERLALPSTFAYKYRIAFNRIPGGGEGSIFHTVWRSATTISAAGDGVYQRKYGNMRFVLPNLE